MADEKENAVATEQFKRNLDHILIKTDVVGPEITIGETVLQFRTKASVRALAALVGNDNKITGMQEYIRKALLPGQDAAFEDILDNVDIQGLSEILNTLSEAYTSFPDQS